MFKARSTTDILETTVNTPLKKAPDGVQLKKIQNAQTDQEFGDIIQKNVC